MRYNRQPQRSPDTSGQGRGRAGSSGFAFMLGSHERVLGPLRRGTGRRSREDEGHRGLRPSIGSGPQATPFGRGHRNDIPWHVRIDSDEAHGEVRNQAQAPSDCRREEPSLQSRQPEGVIRYDMKFKPVSEAVTNVASRSRAMLKAPSFLAFPLRQGFLKCVENKPFKRDLQSLSMGP